MSTLIKNGIIVTENDAIKGDILIEDGVIKEIGQEITKECDEIISAEGKYVIPGGVDVHTHFNIKCGDVTSVDDFYSGTVAAAFGGTTCIVDHMGFGPKGCNLHHQLKLYHELAKDKAVIDYGFHGVVQEVNDSILEEMKDMVCEEGVSSFKIYTTYDYAVNDYDAIRVMKRLVELGAVTCVHCENDGLIKYLRGYFVNIGRVRPVYHALSRPEEAETEAVKRLIYLQYVLGKEASPLYIVHVSTGKAANIIADAKRKGANVLAETCPQYLFLDDNMYGEDDENCNNALKYIMSPPLRNKINNELLWKAIDENEIDTVATDHCSFNFNGDKQLGKDNFTKCPNGAPGVEERIPLMFYEGVIKGRMGINKFAELISTKPSKIFGLYPKKGVIKEGSDADIVIIDPQKEVTLSKANLHGNADYTNYEGMKVKGYPVLTMVRGKVIVKDGKFLGQKGYGQYIKRKKTMA